MKALSLNALVWFSVDIVTQYGVTDVTEMDTYLVSTSCFKAKSHMSVAAVLLYDTVMSDRITGILRCDAHFLAVGLMPSDGSVNSALGLSERAAGNSLILTGEAVSLYLLRKL